MYAVRRWDEEVIKWMAVGLVLSLAFGLFALNSVSPNLNTKLIFEYYSQGEISQAGAIIAALEGADAAYYFLALVAAGAPWFAIAAWLALLVTPIALE